MPKMTVSTSYELIMEIKKDFVVVIVFNLVLACSQWKIYALHTGPKVFNQRFVDGTNLQI